MSVLSRVLSLVEVETADDPTLRKEMEKSFKPAERKAMNRALAEAGFDGRGRWTKTGQALSAVGDVLDKFGVQFYDLADSFKLTRDDKGQLHLRLTRKHPTDPFYAIPVKNSGITFSWTLLDKDRYEVIAYMN